ncbi:Ig-like domain-containing protein [Enterococcus crotali]|uniref:Ig-like domain-containing protein n=1 Tax=Enterococcus crotali TaxID=1453587 RepID=UPI0004705538|nr:Ig-like domain-containing protein [Enterococcus crotali]
MGAFLQTKNSSQLKAAEPEEAVQENILKPDQWGAYYHTGGSVNYAGFNFDEVLRSIRYSGYGRATKDLVYIQRSGSSDTILANEPMYATQSFTLDPKRYYEFRAGLGSSWSSSSAGGGITSYIFFRKKDGTLAKSTEFRMNNQGANPKNIRVNFLASTINEISLRVDQYANVSSRFWGGIQLNNPMLVDITDQVLNISPEIDALFTNETRTQLKLSVTQKEIDQLKERLTSYKGLLEATLMTTLEGNLKKAQDLMNAVVLDLVVEDLVNDPDDEHNRSIIGVTHPNAFLQFSGHSAIPDGELSSGVASDTRNYQIRAAADGTFTYTLPENKTFAFGEEIKIISSLHGKEDIKIKTVLDTIAPEQPTLNRLKDIADSMSGTAEAKTSVHIYDAANDQLFLEGKSDDDGKFTFLLPTEKRPLRPYKKYYATATDVSGNVSQKSDLQEVSDTQAPKAEPVTQYLTLGERLPDLATLYKNLSDNAGAAGINISLTKEPYLSKVGFTTVEITFADKAENQTVITVPIFIKDETIIEDGKHMLFAKDFSALTIDLPTDPEKRKDFLLKNSQAGVWDLVTGESKETELIFDDSNLKRQPGTYEVGVRFGNLYKPFKITLLPGSLSFEKVAEEISYGTPMIRSKEQTIAPETKIEFLINDSRFITQQWRLMAQLKKPLQLKNGEKTASNLFFSKQNELGEWIKEPLTDQMTTELYSHKDAKNGTFSVNFDNADDQAILLDVLPGSIRSDENYETEIVLTLEDGP